MVPSPPYRNARSKLRQSVDRLPPFTPHGSIQSASRLRFREIYSPADKPLVLVARRLFQRLSPFDVGTLQPIGIKARRDRVLLRLFDRPDADPDFALRGLSRAVVDGDKIVFELDSL